jgi:hypothetical protein
MPLVDLSSDDAVFNRKNNAAGAWGDRAGANRVEPIAKPAFDVPFRLDLSDTIFTIGSCFARNVEKALADRGFSLPMRDVFNRPEFLKTDQTILNNYATPCIYNEIAWAFGEETYDPSTLLAELQPGRFVDLNVTSSLRPESLEVVSSRRQAITEAYRSSADCRVIIMTLGLSEVWFDTISQTYLNVSPRPSIMKSDPDRFRLHVLSFAETLGYLTRAVDLLIKHGRADQRLIITVSPVPLAATHRMQDVLVANTYSKSVLRAAAESIVAKYAHAVYFPSFESFVLTDRKLAFIDDLIHTQADLVSFNVGRMVDAYASSSETLDSIRDSIATGGAIVAADKAATIRMEIAEAFFEEHAQRSKESVPFAKAHARFLLRSGQPEAALSILVNLVYLDDLEILSLLIEARLANDEPQMAIDLLEGLPPGRVKAAQIWDHALQAALKLGDPATVASILTRILTNVKSRIPNACLQAARFFRDRGDLKKAKELYFMSFDVAEGITSGMELTELLLTMGRSEEAKAVLRRLKPASVSERLRFDQLTAIA